jgi:pimeloyl-ACP methyl ester carboxylesterase
MPPRSRQRIKFLSRWLLLLFITAILVGFTYEKLGEKRDRERFPQLGRSIDIGGRSLNIFCSGEGRPAVILDTGGTAPGYENLLIQREIGQFTRACWFDRAGLGWSDPSPVEQTSAAVADDLRSLLYAADVPSPYVLVGSSFSGFNVRVFAGKYPKDVAGAILVDSAHEDQYRFEPRVTLAPFNRLPKPIRNLLCAGVPLAARIGLVRLLSSTRPEPPLDPSLGFTSQQWAILQGLERQPKSIVASAICNFEEKSPAQARAAGNLGDRPLIVLTAGQPLTVGDPEADKELRAFHEIWVHQLQQQLAHLSTKGRQVIVENSGHAIDPDAVLNAIHDVVAQIRGN